MVEENIPMVPLTPSFKLLYTSIIYVEVPLELGRSSHGERRIINIKGGAFRGDRMSGRVLPGGADWQVLRNDRVTELEARYTLETYDGALIYVRNWGLRHGPEDVMRRLSAGEEVDASEYYFRTTPVFETGSANYKWLNGIVCIALGQRFADQVIITVYEIK